MNGILLPIPIQNYNIPFCDQNVNRATIVPARGLEPAPLVVLLKPNPPLSKPVVGKYVVVRAAFPELGLGNE
jgi:hypothetical protein